MKSQPLSESDQLRLPGGGGPSARLLGHGDLRLKVMGVRILAPDVRAYALGSSDGEPLPEIEAGAHLTLPVGGDSDSAAVRHYSISSDPDDPMSWEIAVLCRDSGRGGSAFVHANYLPGTELACDHPRNGFELHDDFRPAVLIAGGIGIAPLKSMAHVLQRDQRWFALHLAARCAASAPYLRELKQEFAGNLSTYWSDNGAYARMSLAAVVKQSPAGSVFYVCGPPRMAAEMQTVSACLGVPEGQVRYERFSPPDPHPADRGFEVRMQRDGTVFHVPAGESILDVLVQAGRANVSDCRTGTCGTCATRALEGRPDHRDMVLTSVERSRNQLMCICVSRCLGDRLVLDL